MARPQGRAPMVITHEGGLKFAAQIRSHRLVVDQPVGVGNDTGPMPLELIGASLGTCVALYVHQFCEARGLPCQGMRVEVDQVGAQNPGRIAKFIVRVMLPAALPPQYAEMLERVARSCPAHNTLVHGADVAVEIAVPAPLVAGG
jgi:putative redox protein